jgi:hypothetical protein
MYVVVWEASSVQSMWVGCSSAHVGCFSIRISGGQRDMSPCESKGAGGSTSRACRGPPRPGMLVEMGEVNRHGVLSSSEKGSKALNGSMMMVGG